MYMGMCVRQRLSAISVVSIGRPAAEMQIIYAYA